jgi:glutathione S-transferase
LSPDAFKAKAYLKEGCPFSFKFWLFMVEAGLSGQIEVIRCDPDDAAFESVKAKLAAGLGKPATFPTVEIEPRRYLADSDALIEHYATKHGIDASRLPALAFYEETIFPQLQALH